jgi:DNA-binding IclR family transcriptional regulator
MANRSDTSTAAAEHRSVSRTVAILELAASAEPDGVRLGDLAESIDAPKSSAHGLAKGLVAVGYLREQDGRYFIGPAVLNLLGGKLPTFPAAYHSALEHLVEAWGETAFLATLVGDSSVYVDSVESSYFIRAAPPLNTRVPLWPRSPGKCFLAFMPPRQVDLVLRRSGTDAGQIDQIKAELENIQTSRVAVNQSESEADMIGVASPIIGSRGGPVTLAIAIGGPASRMQPHLDEIVASVRETADSLATWA